MTPKSSNDRYGISLLLMFLILLSCSEKTKTSKPVAVAQKDSTITIFDFPENSKPNKLIPDLAESVLNKHFKKQGYLIESELDFGTFNPEAEENYGKRAIDFIEIKPINNAAALVMYYNCEPFQNGSCVLPHYAIIANTIKGNTIVHEDFLRPDFVIDSIKNEDKGIFIYGYYFECANKKRLDSYRIAIK